MGNGGALAALIAITPLGGEMSDILRGILRRGRLPWLLAHHSQAVVLALFSFINGCLSIGLMAALAALIGSPFVFPSLGPTAFLFFHTPTAPSASPRNTLDANGWANTTDWRTLMALPASPKFAAPFGVQWPLVWVSASFRWFSHPCWSGQARCVVGMSMRQFSSISTDSCSGPGCAESAPTGI